MERVALTCVDELVGSVEDVGGVVLVVGVEPDHQGLVHRDTAARKNAAAVASAERCADQVAAGIPDFRVEVHVLAAAATATKHSVTHWNRQRQHGKYVKLEQEATYSVSIYHPIRESDH